MQRYKLAKKQGESRRHFAGISKEGGDVKSFLRNPYSQKKDVQMVTG